ncbi:MAG: multifunctional CCA addition/repair protein [Succinivibrio sp.]
MQTYLVGGAVRDSLLGLEIKDRDYVVTGATPDDMIKLGYTQVGNDFPVFLHPKTHEEYALARTERKSGSGYTGFICDFSPTISLEDDLIRRDLTINAMAMDDKGNIIDPNHGQDDLKNRILRHVSPAFSEDPLRVLRVARFFARFYHLGFIIADETLDLMKQIAKSGELKSLTPERIFIELEKALESSNPEQFILILRKVGALKEVLPEIDRLFGIPGPVRWHPEIDSGIHTCMTVARISTMTCDKVTRFAMLCHDLGKAETPKVLWPHHRLHNELGIKPLKCLCQRLHVPSEYEQLSLMVVKYHSEMHHLYRKGAEGIVTLLDNLDAFRRPERIKPFILCCKCDFLGRRGFENRPFPRAEYFLAIFSLCSTVKAKEFVDAGFKGKEISNMIRNRRIELVENYLKTIPKDEISDKSNEIPAVIKSPKTTYNRKPQNLEGELKRGFFKQKTTPIPEDEEGDYDL